MADFSPQARRSAMWSGDARRIAAGRQVEVYLEKIGQKPIEDLSGIEAVQIGLTMQPAIAKEFERRTGMTVRDLDIEGTHPSEPWMRSHFDYELPNRKLLEVKNYHLNARSKFGESGSQEVPVADWAQCIHEASVYGTDLVYLCVLFGGQELCWYPLEISNEMKEALMIQEAAIWAGVQTKTPPESQHPEDLRAIFPVSQARIVKGDQSVAMAVHKLKIIREQRKALEEAEETLQGQVQALMKDADELLGPDGERLATWKSAKASQRFDAKLFEQSMPDIYKQFVREMPGSRRFLVK